MITTYQTLIAWVSALSGVTTYIRFPNQAPPPKPYVELRISADTEQSYYQHYGDEQDTINRWYGFTLSLQVHGRNDAANILEAETIATRIKDRINDQLLRNLTLGNDLSFVRVLGSQDITTTIGTEYEPRYSIDLRMNSSREIVNVSANGVIERWEVGGIVNNAVNKIPVDGASLDLDYIENEFSTQNAFNDVNFRQVAVEAQIDGYMPEPEDGDEP